MNRELREEMNRLSKETFGASSRWQKIVNHGVLDKVVRDREVTVPGPKGLEVKTFTDSKLVTRRSTVEEVKALMEGILAERNKPTSVQTDLLDGKLHTGTTLDLSSNVPVNTQTTVSE